MARRGQLRDERGRKTGGPAPSSREVRAEQGSAAACRREGMAAAGPCEVEQRGGGEVEGEADVWAPHVSEGRERSSKGILDHTKIHESVSGSKSIKDV